MKTLRKTIALAGFTAAALSFAPHSQASVTGQWDFKNSANPYAATFGTDLQALDSPTSSGTSDQSTAGFGIANIAGTSVNVMNFPKLPANGAPPFGSSGYYCTVGAAGNGGGINVNQYTIIMDVLYPAGSDLKTRPLFLTDASFSVPTPSSNAGEALVSTTDTLGIPGGTGTPSGTLTPSVWHRVAVTVDTSSTIDMYIDGVAVYSQTTPGGQDGLFSIASAIVLFNDYNTNSQSGYVASLQFQDVKQPAGYIASLGTPVAAGINPSGLPPNPYVVSYSPTDPFAFVHPTAATVSPQPNIQIALADGTTTVNTNTIQLKLNGVAVPATVNYSAPNTTISYQVTNFLSALSSNSVSLAYQDSSANPLGLQWAFVVGPYASLPTNAVLSPAAVNTPGFVYRVAQADPTAILGANLVQALQQLDGTLLNNNGVPYANIANLSGAGYQSGETFFIDQFEGGNGTVSFEGTDATFYHLPGLTTYSFPGITPDGSGHTLNFSDESMAYVQLAAGTYVFGVNVGIGRVDASGPTDNGYILTCGANPRDYFSPVIGQFARTGSNFGDSQNTNQFTFVAPVAGVYPFRLLHWNAGTAAVNGGFQNTAAAGLYYIDPVSGHAVLVNDPSGSIPAYRVSSVPREPYIAEVYPSPNGSGFLPTAPIKIVMSDDDLVLNPASIKMTYNGASVTPTVSKSGSLTTIVYNPNTTRSTTTNLVQLVYADNSGSPKTNSSSWTFSNVVGGSTIPQVTGQWDFNNCDLSATVGQPLQYFDGPSGLTAAATKFGTCSSFGIPTINGFDASVMYVPGQANGSANKRNYGYTMFPNIAPNGGGQRVNQYTIIWDMYYQGSTITFFNCQDPTNNTTDGSLFLQNGTMGQGGGGYNMRQTIGTGWHRIAFAVDLAQGLITKWVDGTKQADWTGGNNTLDNPRRSLLPQVDLFADGDGDDNTGNIYVRSIQISSVKLSDAEMAALGTPDGKPIPTGLATTTVTGQWNFNYSNLWATVGSDLQYFDGPTGLTSNATVFATCSAFGIPLIGGVDTPVMYVPGQANGAPNKRSYGYTMFPNIAPNGGGQRINQYTIIWDMYYQGSTITFFNCQDPTNNTTDGSLFLQNGAMGQGGGGYTMNNGPVTTGWHRLAFAVDLAQGLITKWVDGVKAQDWTGGNNVLDNPRRSLLPQVDLFADGDTDDNTGNIYVKSIQISAGKASDAQMQALGGPSPYGIPVSVSVPATPPTLSIVGNANGTVTVSWPPSAAGWGLEETTSLAPPIQWTTCVSGVVSNSISFPASVGPLFFRLHQ